MRILDENTDQSITNVTLYLTLSEAIEMRDSLQDPINGPLNNHSHISSDDHQKEITVCVYERENLNGFSERSKNLIINDQ